MKETLGRDVSDLRKAGSARRRWQEILLVASLFLTACITAPGCGSRIARVEVPDEDLIKANQLAQEGSEAYRNKDYYASLIKYLMASQLNPNSEYISNRLGMSYLQMEYNKKAIETFQRSMALNSKYPFSVNNLGSAFFADGNYKKAEKYFKKAIKMKGDEAVFYLNLGRLYFEKKKPDQAIIAWRKSLELDPEILTKSSSVSLSIGGEDISLKDRNYFMARIYAATGNIPKVIECLENALLNGFSDIDMIRNNPEFDPIRKDKRFVEFMKSATAWNRRN